MRQNIVILILLILLLATMVIISHRLTKADQKKMVDELTEQLGLEEWQTRVLREYLQG